MLHGALAIVTFLNVSCASFRKFDNSAELLDVTGVVEGGLLSLSLYNSSEQDLMLILSSRDIVYYEVFTGKDYASETGGDLYPGRIMILQKNTHFAESAWSTSDAGVSLRQISIEAKDAGTISKVIVKPFIVPFSALRGVKSYRDLLALAQQGLRGYQVKLTRPENRISAIPSPASRHQPAPSHPSRSGTGQPQSPEANETKPE